MCVRASRAACAFFGVTLPLPPRSPLSRCPALPSPRKGRTILTPRSTRAIGYSPPSNLSPTHRALSIPARHFCSLCPQITGDTTNSCCLAPEGLGGLTPGPLLPLAPHPAHASHQRHSRHTSVKSRGCQAKEMTRPAVTCSCGAANGHHHARFLSRKGGRKLSCQAARPAGHLTPSPTDDTEEHPGKAVKRLGIPLPSSPSGGWGAARRSALTAAPAPLPAGRPSGSAAQRGGPVPAAGLRRAQPRA
ncbi:uncharacterized protein LOC129736497 [Falco cherrug]|uniref:uncharacterized protein LOC129736497 n=1 Tax=Falco cherrug TaxID=345164 RepID=UPI00247AAA83|nr:uncharacterized protein LOC129736497 [Falco cherrug]XP_055666923.1 uncharacterized protein LOC129784913 [Falco peregrinus]